MSSSSPMSWAPIEPLPPADEKWKLAANAQYQEAMKILTNLATASLVLPVFFVKNFLPEKTPFPAGGPGYCAWLAWILLFLSLLFDGLFYWASAKFVKVVCGGDEGVPNILLKMFFVGGSPSAEAAFEKLRDRFIGGAILSFFFGLVLLLVFFRSLLTLSALLSPPPCGP